MNILTDNLHRQFFLLKTVRFVGAKEFSSNTMLFFALLGTASRLKIFYKPLHKTKNSLDSGLKHMQKTSERRQASAVQNLLRPTQTHTRPTQTLDDLTFFKKKFCLMCRLKFILSDVTLFSPDRLHELKKNSI